MTRSNAAVILLALVCAAALAATADAAYCHQSGYSGVDCNTAKTTKRALWAACGPGTGLVAPVPGSEMCPAGGSPCAYTVVQQFTDKAAFERYDTCEHSKPEYKAVFAGKAASACKSDKQC